MGTPDEISTSGAIILFDGVCNLCNGAVQFIIKRDPNAYFRFAALQSETGQRLFKEAGLLSNQLDTIVLLEDGRAYMRSDAALRIARRLQQPWPLWYGARVLPRVLRDGLYNLIARYRYRLFGKQESCMIPTPALKARFLPTG